MRLVILVCQLGLILRTEAQIPSACIVSSTNRPPENSDITVVCGTERMELSIYLCPVYQALYNESLMVLNNQYNIPKCFGTADWSVDPPVLKFRFPINDSSISSCNNNFKIINQVGSGAFADFSNVQFVNISGTVTSIDPSAGMITYRPQILYKFSCMYPMQYLLNNTEVAVSGANLAIRDNNGSFISTLSMRLYKDGQYQEILTIPQSGLNLKTKIYVAVTATNLTDRFNVLLDRCYATTSPHPMLKTYYDLFIGCTRDAQTKVELNGASQRAHFSFEAFRFVEHKNLTISTFYLHCVTRLCEVSSCRGLMPDCGVARRKREAQEVLANATVTSPAIVVGKQSSGDAQTLSASYAMPSENYSSPVVAVIVCIVILTIVLVTMAVYVALYIRRRKPVIQ
ncbi:zona pellucida-like domain-containing protein 1 [Siniperca chuatsi]|uniref:zona pellucida-like domain-containing protein 1 n=1 Tax=Siniperca chuatsi TaxID=119488 RepID=UPI001CE0FDBE|nr:zona pellucida-like domain-containing protein 1 [Siniperca chuatsi]XP_044058410.1 zona pellucida-like domain-containing protein 1 [Siniperca chuatsi]